MLLFFAAYFGLFDVEVTALPLKECNRTHSYHQHYKHHLPLKGNRRHGSCGRGGSCRIGIVSRIVRDTRLIGTVSRIHHIDFVIAISFGSEGNLRCSHGCPRTHGHQEDKETNNRFSYHKTPCEGEHGFKNNPSCNIAIVVHSAGEGKRNWTRRSQEPLEGDFLAGVEKWSSGILVGFSHVGNRH